MKIILEPIEPLAPLTKEVYTFYGWYRLLEYLLMPSVNVEVYGFIFEGETHNNSDNSSSLFTM